MQNNSGKTHYAPDKRGTDKRSHCILKLMGEALCNAASAPAQLCPSQAAHTYLSHRSRLSFCRGSKCRLVNWAVFDGARLAMISVKPESGLTIRELIGREVQQTTDRSCLRRKRSRCRHREPQPGEDLFLPLSL